MEKIVQYPLPMPTLLEHHATQLIDRFLNEAAAEREHSFDDCRRGTVTKLAGQQLTTPRAIKRFGAQLRHQLSLFDPGEVDAVDVALLTLLRVTTPVLHEKLPRHKQELVRDRTVNIAIEIGEKLSGSGSRRMFEPLDLDTLLPASGPLPAGPRAVLHELFPRLRQGGSVPSGTLRICVGEYFDRYFVMDVLDHDLSNVVVSSAVVEAALGNPAKLNDLLEDPDPTRAYRALTKASLVQLDTDAQRLQVAETVAQRTGELPDRGLGNLNEQALYFIAKLVRECPSADGNEVNRVLDLLPTTNALWVCQEITEDTQGHRRDVERPGWLAMVGEHATLRAVDSFMASVLAGDDAPGEPTWFYFERIRHRPTAMSDLQGRVGQAIAEGHATVEDVLTRLVGRTLTPVGGQILVLSEESAKLLDLDLPQPEPPAEPYQPQDDSWASKRMFVHSGAWRTTRDEPQAQS